MKTDDKHTIDQELLNTEILTQKEAREYIKSQLKIGDTYYYQCVLPEIRHYFMPIGKNYQRKRVAMLRIRKVDLERYVIRHKRQLFR